MNLQTNGIVIHNQHDTTNFNASPPSFANPIFTWTINCNTWWNFWCMNDTGLATKKSKVARKPSKSSPDCKARHKASSKEQHQVRYYLESEVAAHSLTKKIRSNEIHQSHINQNPSRKRVQDALNHQCTGTMRIVGRWDGSSNPNTQWGSDSKKTCHQWRRLSVELGLRNTASKGKSFKKLMEG